MNQTSTPSAPTETEAQEAEDSSKGYIPGFKWDPSKPLRIGFKGFRIVETDRREER